MSQNRASVLRQISVEGMETFPVTPQPAPQLLWLSVDDLVIDDRYQRPLNPNNWAAIKRIAKEFRWSRFSPILVAPVEGGRYALIDGQHRAHAAALCRIESIPAMVALVAPEEQALAFIEINTRQIRVSGHVFYRAALAAGEEWAIVCRVSLSKMPWDDSEGAITPRPETDPRFSLVRSTPAARSRAEQVIDAIRAELTEIRHG